MHRSGVGSNKTKESRNPVFEFYKELHLDTQIQNI